jgi:2-keto-4-pentenoate hydratase/2-oxohepta-3-ene-1,7-dioic acid hydratase in catechol pathway
MKICRFTVNNQIKTGVIDNEKVFSYENNQKLSDSYNLHEIKLLPPVEPSKIVCVGRNYAEHAAELGNTVPTEPLLFLKAPSALITDGEDILLPEQSNRVEHEGELALVIGRDCKNLADSVNALEYVFGYTILNDVTARDLQRADVQFTRAKSFDTFCPVASFIETDLDTTDIKLTTKVNGEIKQTGRTSQMVFNVDFLIRYISRQMSLKAGDVIATGTPSGVSQLKNGDVCEVEIEGIGKLSNPVKRAN